MTATVKNKVCLMYVPLLAYECASNALTIP